MHMHPESTKIVEQMEKMREVRDCGVTGQ